MDALLALMLAGLVLTPLVQTAHPDPAVLAQVIPLLWVMCLILMTLGLRGASPGKRWLKLRLEGPGCLVCREIRRWGWALIWAAAPLVQGGLGSVLAASAAILVVWLYLRPLWLGHADLPHNLATGIRVTAQG